MVNDVVLSSPQKLILLSNQRAQSTIDKIQEALATGKEVNRAIDAPLNFFTSKALSNRAGDLDRLLDNIGQGVRTLEETVIGIEAIQSLLDQADALLKEAEIELYSDKTPQPNVIIEDSADLTAYVPSQNIGGVIDVEEDGTSLFLDGNLWQRLELDYEITENTVLRFEYESSNIPEISAIGFDNDQIFTNDNDRFFVYGTQTSGLNYSAPINAFEYDGSGTSQTIEIPVGQYFQGDFDHITFVHDDDGAGDDGDALFTSITLFETNDTVLPYDLKERAAEYKADYNNILDQIDLVAKDANYRGINLLQEEVLTTFFNETNTSSLKTEGINATRKGLGLIEANFSRLSFLQQSQGQVLEARTQLWEYTSSIQNNLFIIKQRETLSRNIINTLKSGSDDLVLADQNKKGAELLAMQTRQSLGVTALSLASQSYGSVLRLF